MRDQILVTACTVLVVTLVFPGLPLPARREPGADPEVADHVLRKLDLQTMIVPDRA